MTTLRVRIEQENDNSSLLSEDRPAELILARLVTLDSLPFHKLKKSRDIQNLSRGQGFDTRHETMLVSYAEKIKR